MYYVIIFALVILFLYCHHLINKKIDDDERTALGRDGHATFIRENFPSLAEKLSERTGWNIFKERDDAILLGNKDSEYISIHQWSGNLRVVHVSYRQIINEWEFPVGTTTDYIISQIL